MADPPPDAADTPDSVIDLTGDQSQDPSPPEAQGQPQPQQRPQPIEVISIDDDEPTAAAGPVAAWLVASR